MCLIPEISEFRSDDGRRETVTVPLTERLQKYREISKKDRSE